jgi:hypothetical protein
MRCKKAFLPLLPLTLLLILAACTTTSETGPLLPEETVEDIVADIQVEFLIPAPGIIALNNDPKEREKEVEKPIKTTEPQQIFTKKPPTSTAIYFTGKIGILTSPLEWNEPAYYYAQQLVEEYGEEKILHDTWSKHWRVQDSYSPVRTVIRMLASDDQVKALIINQTVPVEFLGVNVMRENHDDTLIILVGLFGNQLDTETQADLTIICDYYEIGSSLVLQAKKMGAKTFVHYSFPRFLAFPQEAACRELIKQTCEETGIVFVDATTIDPYIPDEDRYIWEEAQQAVLESVPVMIEKYGKDTAFFVSIFGLHESLIKAVVDNGAIYTQPDCHYPYYGLPKALGIAVPDEGILDLDYVIAEISRILKDKGMQGRLSAWPMPFSMLSTYAAAEYAVKWINGEDTKEGIDVEALKQIMEEYAGVEVFLTPYTDEYPYTDNGTGETYDNVLMMRMGYVTF